MLISMLLIIDPGTALLAAGGASVLSSLLGGLFGKSGQSSANKTNVAIANATNATNREINQEQLAYNKWALEEQNRYNSAPEQVARLKAAGLNPALFMGTSAAGQAGSAPSYSPMGAQGTTVENENEGMSNAFMSLGPSIQSAVFDTIDAEQKQKIVDAQKKNYELDAELKGVDLQTKAEMNIATLKKMKAEARTEEERSEIEASIKRVQQQTEKYQIEFQQEQVNKMRAEFEKAVAEKNLIAVNQQIQEKNLEWMDAEKTAALNKTLAEIQVAYTQGSLNMSQANLAAQQALKTQADKAGVEINNKILRKSANGIIRKANWEGTKARYEAVDQSWRAAGNRRGYVYGAQFHDPISQGYRQMVNTLGSPLSIILQGALK